MKAFCAFLVCIMLLGCGAPAQQSPTATATMPRTLTPTLQPDLTAIKKAIQGATQTMAANHAAATSTARVAPTVTARAEGAIMLNEIADTVNKLAGIDIHDAILYLGPRDGKIEDTPDNFVATYDSGLILKNFVASIKFINPYDTATKGKWDYGLFFRNQRGNKQYRLIVLSNQSWTLLNSLTNTYIYSSNDKSLKSKAGEENTIWLIVFDNKAYLFVNGSYVKTMNLGKGPVRGDVSPAAGIYYGNVMGEDSTDFRDFTVWSLP